MSIFVFHSQGYLQNLHLVAGDPNAHSLQCPGAPEDCPTCGEFQALRKSLLELRADYRRELTELRERVSLGSAIRRRLTPVS